MRESRAIHPVNKMFSYLRADYYEHWSQAALAYSDQRNGSPERQTLCKITESFLASATRALPLPDRLAIARAQSFKLEAF
jgi:hypothetical protein